MNALVTTVRLLAVGAALAVPLATIGTAFAAAELRAAQQTPDRLVVTKTQSDSNDRSAKPFTKTFTDQSSVEKLYADIAALPPFPSGPMNCPNNSGLHYQLDFYSGPVSLLTADYNPSGCASIKLSNGVIKNDRTGSFKADFDQALGASEN